MSSWAPPAGQAQMTPWRSFPSHASSYEIKRNGELGIMNTMDPRLSQGVAVIAAVAIVVLSWQCGYQPAVRAYRRDRQQKAEMTTRLAHVDAMVQTAGDMEIWRTRSLQRLATLKSRLPPSSQLPHLLNALVDGVKTQDVKLIDVSQGNVEPVQDGEQPVLVDGQPCARLPVTV